MRRTSARWWLGIGLLSIALSSGVFGLAASNTVPATKAGDGSGAISGYVLSGVHYTLNGTDPALIDQVAFTLDSAPVAGSTLKAQLVSAGSWYTCTNAGTAVTCNTTSPQATVLPANNLRVVIAQ
ncbi:MAG TPA: hypothetical protein VIC58_06025 [Actinomycetota bacterium]|jgi:hypothetical protein